jgi:hypothetical protein
MCFPSLFRRRLANGKLHPRRSQTAALRRPAFETLEDRTALSTLFIVPGGTPTDSTHFLRYQNAYQAAVAGDTIQVQAGTAISSVGAGAQGSQISGGGAGTSSMEIDNSSIGAGELVQVSGGGGETEIRLVDRVWPSGRFDATTLIFNQPLANAHDGTGGQVTSQGILGVGKQLTIQGDVGAPGAIAANMEVLAGVTGATFRNVDYLGFDSLTLDAGSKQTSILDSRLTRVTETIGPNLGNQGNVLARNVITGFAVMNGDVSITTGDQILDNLFITSGVTSLFMINNNGAVIQGNTFITAGPRIQAIELVNSEHVQVRNNIITVTGGALSVGVALLNSTAQLGPAMSATVANNMISTAGRGTGLLTKKEDTPVSSMQVTALGNDFHNNAVGVLIEGDGSNAGIVDLGNRSTNAQTGGNNFRGFTAAGAAAGRFAIALENTASTSVVSAIDNLWSVADPTTVVKDGTHNTLTGSDTGTGTINTGGTTQLTEAEEFVATLYENFLGRTGTLQEWDMWVSVFPNLGQSGVANAIAHSPESLKRIVDGLYLKFLGRAADAGGEAGFIGFLQQGGTIEQAINIFLSSDEYFNRVKDTFGDTQQSFIQSLYNNLLGRHAPGTEVQGWVSALPSLGRSGVINGFLTSQEFRAKSVTQFFMTLLHRSPTSSELSELVNSTQDLLTIEIGIASLAEYFTDG